MSYAIGIDLGGTNIKAVAVTAGGEVLDRSSCGTADDGSGGWAERVRAQVEALEARRGAPATWVGLAAPGLPARDSRSIVSIPERLAGLEGLDWTEYLGGGRAVPVLNDAQAALVAEAWCGAAAGCRHALMLTLGTGVGGAILCGGALMRGALGRAGEVGHVTLQADGEADQLGIPGSLEAAIGNGTLPARSRGRFMSTRDLVDAYRAGDPEAAHLWLRSVHQLACAVASLINIVDPEVVVLGGGIAGAGRDLFEPLERFLEPMEWKPYGRGVRVVPAALGEYAGALGAARNAMGRADRTARD
jgi:glucokinase